MKDLFQQETVNEVISLIDKRQPTSRRRWRSRGGRNDGTPRFTRWENWRSDHTLAMLEFRALLSPEETSLYEEIIEDREFFLRVA